MQVNISLLFPAVHCLFPRVRYGTVSPQRVYYKVWETVTFTCNSGYTLRGPRSSTCGAGSRWDPPLPECKKGECPAGKAPSCVLSDSVGRQNRGGCVLASLLRAVLPAGLAERQKQPRWNTLGWGTGMAVPCLGLREGWGEVDPVGRQDLNPRGIPDAAAGQTWAHLHCGMENNHNFSLLLLLPRQ